MTAARLSHALALLLLAWQAVVVQAHVHVRPVATPPSASVGPAASTAPQRPDNPVDCPVCREVAHAGQYLSPGPVLLQAPVSVASWRADAMLTSLSFVRHSHSWRSRAPPLPLPQA